MKNSALLLLVLFILIAGAGFGVYHITGWTLGVVLLFAGVILAGSTLIMKREIDLWLMQKGGGTLTEKETSFLNDSFALMKFLPEKSRTSFYKKIHLFKLDKEIVSQYPDGRIPHQAVLLCGAYASFFDPASGTVRSPLPENPVYVFYGHPFPSPVYMKNLHITEYHPEDGALLFSVPHLIKGNENPVQFLNIALYETWKAARKDLMNCKYVTPDLRQLCYFGGYSLPDLEKYVGLPAETIDAEALAASLYFSRPEKFVRTFPDWGKEIADRFPLILRGN